MNDTFRKLLIIASMIFIVCTLSFMTYWHAVESGRVGSRDDWPWLQLR